MKYIIIALAMLALAGCGSTRPAGSSPPTPSARETYTYRAVNDNCNCEEYRTQDRDRGIGYKFRASYKMNHGIITTIEIEFINDSHDTLFLETGTARVSSRNIAYQYNNKHVPLPHLVVAPSRSETVKMEGSDISGKDDWNKIAGEQIVLTLQGIRLSDRKVAAQHVTFVPENPMLKQ